MLRAGRRAKRQRSMQAAVFISSGCIDMHAMGRSEEFVV
jgi:hypothetical protein